VQYTEDQSAWLEEWLEENDIKSLEDCKVWKDSVPLLQSAVIGIPTLSGSGCTNCNFGHERQREVTGHMRDELGIEDIAPIQASLQQVFASQLRGFWRIADPVIAEDPTDEGLTALHRFRTEFHEFQQEDRPSSIGM
jgi:hypothetical protein